MQSHTGPQPAEGCLTEWVGSENLWAKAFGGVLRGMEVNWHWETSLCGLKANQGGGGRH